MVKIYADAVKQFTTTTGTGTVDLTGSIPSGFFGFVDKVGDGNTCDYVIYDPITGDREIGEGTVTDDTTDTLSRDTIYVSTNSDALVSFVAGTKEVYLTLSAQKISNFDEQAWLSTIAYN